MPLTVALQMDPIGSVNINADSTFRIAIEAQSRGHRLFYYTPDRLAFVEGRVMARGWWIELRHELGNHVSYGEETEVDLGEIDVVWLRQDPPFDMGYITATHLLDQIHPKTLVVNDPAEVRNAPEKLFILRYSDYMPATLITRDWDELAAFRRAHGDIILKPLYGNGGAGIFKTHKDDQNFSSLLEMFGQLFKEPIIAQKYLPEVRAGDKRIILVDGKVAGAINRVPASHDHRSNMHAGGKAEPTTLTKREHEICEAIGPDLRKRGLIFTGIDVIGDYMTEINVTSPTGIRQVQRFGGADIAALIWDAIEARR